MPTTRVATDAFGVVTIALVALTAILGLLCIYRCVYFQLQIRRRGFSQLSYFNGPWIIRIVLIIISIWWGFGEIVRLSFLRGTGRPLSSLTWQKYGCKFYLLSNLGFAEPIIFIMLGFLLHAALQKRESDSLTQRWNWKTFIYVILLCLPLFILQLFLIIYNQEMHKMRKKMGKFFMTHSFSLPNNMTICTYPLLSTIILGFFDLFVIAYVVYSGARMLSLVINKGLRLRVYLLALSVIFFLPLRVILLGFSVLPHVGNMAYEVLVFVAFLVFLLCNMIGICMLVYLPVADSLALREIEQSTFKTDEIPCDDYCSEGTALIHNLNHPDSRRNSISFCNMIRDDLPQALNGIDERRRSIPFRPLHIVCSVESSPCRE
ncbi:uncharacterized protein LOC110100094 [Dendrobium catenatum]|uniref:Uncharacterized protein n=1 Tax=Dendrobium catenatum TaxID=906689 RepID=A0A2I0XE16_9ASPA|nr:uncharacterized protein LOC110100094 [Dendrobium catenatum]PKU86156.1 hypothetical protein MA16_Dca001987 [Dendrobium catenatum]